MYEFLEQMIFEEAESFRRGSFGHCRILKY